MPASCVTRLLSCFAGGEQIAHTATNRPGTLRLIATRAGKGVYVALGGAHSTAALIGPKVVGLHLQVVAVDFRSRAGRAQIIIVSEGWGEWGWLCGRDYRGRRVGAVGEELRVEKALRGQKRRVGLEEGVALASFLVVVEWGRWRTWLWFYENELNCERAGFGVAVSVQLYHALAARAWAQVSNWEDGFAHKIVLM